MAHYQVYWRKGNGRAGPLASHWYELNGVITWASPVLERWVGKSHRDLLTHLHFNPAPMRGMDPAPRYAERLDEHCVPPTLKYHKQLMQCIAALLEE